MEGDSETYKTELDQRINVFYVYVYILTYWHGLALLLQDH